MKKFGLGKKSSQNTETDDSSRSKLFGSKSRSAKSTPASSNPYAVSQGDVRDPYAPSPTPAYQAPANYSNSPSASSTQLPPPSYDRGYQSSSRNDNYGSAKSGYSNQGSYGAQSGYGTSRYESPGPSQSAVGGYGGLGRVRSTETMNTEAGRDALFGGARERYQQHQQQQEQSNGPADKDESGGGAYGSVGYGSVDNPEGYGQNPKRELTAEEQEEEDVQATKEQIRFIKQQDVSSTRNALRIAQQAEETGRATLERLGQQGERIHNTEYNLDAASRENRLAAEKASELKTLNRSMFAVHVNNPFTKNQRERDREAKLMDTHHAERNQQTDTRAAAYASLARQRELDRNFKGPAPQTYKKDIAERSKYQFEADSDDEAMEEEIDGNLGTLHGTAQNLHLIARAMGTEIDTQNKHIDRITGKAEKVDDGIVLNRARLDRIH